MLEKSEEFITNLKEEFQNVPFFLLKTGCLNNLDEHINNYEDLHVLLQLAKLKIIMIHEEGDNAIDSTFKYFLNLLDKFQTIKQFEKDLLKHILLIQSSTTNLHLLMEYVLSKLESENDENNILFYLEIMLLMIQLNIPMNNLIVKYTKELHGIILKIINTDDNNIQVKVTTLVVEYYKCTKSDTIFSDIWKCLKKNSKLNIFSALQEYFIPNKYDGTQFCILNDNQLWHFLQEKLMCDDVFEKKQSLNFLKYVIRVIFENELYISMLAAPSAIDIVKINKNDVNSYKQAWDKVLLLCDISNKKQLHLIVPNFKFYKCLQVLHISWRKCITALFLKHPHNAVAKKVIQLVLISEWDCNINDLIDGLNNYNVFTDSLKMRSYFHSYFTKLDYNQAKLFIDLISTKSFNYIAFYYIFEEIKNFKLKAPDFDLINRLLDCCEKLPHVFIRNAIKYSIFSFFCNTVLSGEYFFDSEFHKLIELINRFLKDKFVYYFNISEILGKWIGDGNKFSSALQKYITLHEYDKSIEIPYSTINDRICLHDDVFNISHMPYVKYYLNYCWEHEGNPNFQNDIIKKALNFLISSTLSEEKICKYINSFSIPRIIFDGSLFFRELDGFETVLLLLKSVSTVFKTNNKYFACISICEKIYEIGKLYWKQYNVEHVMILEYVIESLNDIQKLSFTEKDIEKKIKRSTYLLYHRVMTLKDLISLERIEDCNGLMVSNESVVQKLQEKIMDELNVYVDEFDEDFLLIYLEFYRELVSTHSYNNSSLRLFLEYYENKLFPVNNSNIKLVKIYLDILLEDRVIKNCYFKNYINSIVVRMIDNKEYNVEILLTFLCMIKGTYSSNMYKHVVPEALLIGIANRKIDRCVQNGISDVYSDKGINIVIFIEILKRKYLLFLIIYSKLI